MEKNNIREQFLLLKNLKDVAHILHIKPSKLSYILYHHKNNRSDQYISFEIPKRQGGVRIVSAPNSSLKHYQKQLLKILEEVYWKKPSVHGFVPNRSIITNAYCHKNSSYIVNIDLKNFFPSIHFGRVLGLFQSKPYLLPFESAKVLAQISCTDHLPQGAPSSPIISNMICSYLDYQLQKYSNANKCFYTRYADDITFSSNHACLPKGIGIFLNNNTIKLSSKLEKIIEENGFKINRKKTRVQTKYQRQIVTGLTVNKFPNVSREYIKDIRAILHNWETKGIEVASKKYINRYISSKTIKDEHSFFIKSVRGKIAHIVNVRKASSELINLLNKKNINGSF